jgi:hypothetical protein
MSPYPTPYGSLDPGNDRRRAPRYYCGGLARISCLPLYGSLLTARLRDLGPGGCSVECPVTLPLLDLGVRTEILVEVNSWSFRALAHVRAIRAHSGISMEFARLSAGGSSMLADLIAELEEMRMPTRSPKSKFEHQRQLGPLDRQSRHNSPAIVGTVMPSDSSIEIPHRCVRAIYPPANRLDIFV